MLPDAVKRHLARSVKTVPDAHELLIFRLLNVRVSHSIRNLSWKEAMAKLRSGPWNAPKPLPTDKVLEHCRAMAPE